MSDLTARLALAIRRMSDADLARMVREGLDDRSLITLATAFTQLEHGNLHPIGDPNGSEPAPTRARTGVTKRVEDLVRSEPGISAYDIRRQLKQDTPTGVRKALSRLLDKGLIRREGRTSGSRYFPVWAPEPAEEEEGVQPPDPPSGSATPPPSTHEQGRNLRAEILSLLDQAQPNGLSPRELREKTGRGVDAVTHHLRKLMRDGLIVATGSSKTRRYFLPDNPLLHGETPEQ